MSEGRSIGVAWRRHRALVRLSRAALYRTFLARSGRVSAWYVAATHAALLVWLSKSEGEHELSFVLVRALSLLTFAAGLVALGAALDSATQSPVWDLSRARGATYREQELARVVAAFESAAWPTFLAGTIVALVALVLSSTFAAAFAAILRALSVAGYAVLVGVLIGVPARFAARISPTHPRLAYLGIVLLPEALRAVRGDVPSIAAVLGGALDRVAGIAGGIG